MYGRFSYWTVSDLFLAECEIPPKLKKLPVNRFLRLLQWRHTNTNTADENDNGSVNMTNKVWICTHWISTSVLWYLMDQFRCFWIWNKKQQTIPKNRSRYTKKNWYNKTITALHFVQYDVLWTTEKQYWPRPKCNNCIISLVSFVWHRIPVWGTKTNLWIEASNLNHLYWKIISTV